MKTYKAHLPSYLFDVFVGAESIQGARSRLRETLGIDRLPAGTVVYEAPVADEALRYEGHFHTPQSLTIWWLPVKVTGANSPPLITLELPELD